MDPPPPRSPYHSTLQSVWKPLHYRGGVGSVNVYVSRAILLKRTSQYPDDRCGIPEELLTAVILVSVTAHPLTDDPEDQQDQQHDPDNLQDQGNDGQDTAWYQPSYS